jgi:hypothetical protein
MSTLTDLVTTIVRAIRGLPLAVKVAIIVAVLGGGPLLALHHYRIFPFECPKDYPDCKNP